MQLRATRAKKQTEKCNNYQNEISYPLDTSGLLLDYPEISMDWNFFRSWDHLNLKIVETQRHPLTEFCIRVVVTDGGLGHPGCGIPCSVAPIIIRLPPLCCQSTRPHFIWCLTGGKLSWHQPGDWSRGCITAKASQRDLSLQKMSRTDSYLPETFSGIKLLGLIVVLTVVWLEDWHGGIKLDIQICLSQPWLL